jgi:homospermidine synthase
MNLAAEIGEQEESSGAEELGIVRVGHEGEDHWSGHNRYCRTPRPGVNAIGLLLVGVIHLSGKIIA